MIKYNCIVIEFFLYEIFQEQSFNRYLKQAQEFLELPYNIGSHSLRKTWGKFYYQKHKDIATVMKILNHSSVEVTLRYIGLDREWIYKVYENFIV